MSCCRSVLTLSRTHKPGLSWKDMDPKDKFDHLNKAIFSNNVETFSQILQTVSDVESLQVSVLDSQRAKTDSSPMVTSPLLHTVCMLQRASMLQSLLVKGASVVRQNSQKKYPVEVLLQFWPRLSETSYLDPSTDSAKQLILIVKDRETNARACLHHLLDYSASVDSRSSIHKDFLLHLCAKMNLWTPFKDLISAGADSEAREINGCTPLLVAARYGAKDIVADLLNNGVNVHVRNVQSRNVLHLAVLQPLIPATLFSDLIRAGADIDCTDSRGNSPLHLAAENNQYKKIHVLLEHGCNADLKNGRGQTALNIALSRLRSKHGYYACIHLVSEMTLINLVDEEGRVPPTLLPGGPDETLGHLVLMLAGRVPNLQSVCCQAIKRCLGRKRRTKHYLDQLMCPNVVKRMLLLKSPKTTEASLANLYN